MDLDVVDLIYYRSYQQILKYINPQGDYALGFVYRYIERIIRKRKKKKGKRTWRLSTQLQYPGLWFDASPHPSSVSSPCRLSISSVVRSIWVEASSLGSTLCHLVLPKLGLAWLWLCFHGLACIGHSKHSQAIGLMAPTQAQWLNSTASHSSSPKKEMLF